MGVTDDLIFVSIASFRDSFLPFTIDSVISQARFPERLRFGICWQNDSSETLDCLGDPRFRVIRYPYEESLGYGWARAEIQRLYRGEPYHLLIDSHSCMAEGWDVELIEELQRKPSQKPILTTSSPPFRLDDNGKVVKPWEGTRLDGVPRLRSRQIPPAWIDVQMSNERSAHPDEPTYLLCFNFLFTHGRWIVEVPEDPDMINAGHEAPLSARSFTHGYDSFLPEKIYLWHLDYREYEDGVRHKVWDESPKSWQQQGTVFMIDRLRALWGHGDAALLGDHGAGPNRTIEEWARRVDLDLGFGEQREMNPDRSPISDR